MQDHITITGNVGTTPKYLETSSGLSITSFRLGSTIRKLVDRESNRWEDGDTNWYTVSAYRQLARNAASSLRVGDPVVVSGRLKVRAWETDERTGITVEIDADSIGHDLLRGTTAFTRNTTSGRAREEDTFSELEAREAAAVARAEAPAPAANEDAELAVPF